MKTFLIFAAMAPLLVALEALGAQGLTVDETYRIVIAEDRTKAEEHAAAQLHEYLKKITGGTLKIVPETNQNAGPAIYVGQTKFAAAHGMADVAQGGPGRPAVDQMTFFRGCGGSAIPG